MEYLEAPGRVSFPINLARELQGMMRGATGAKAFTLDSVNDNELHVTFDTKPRLFGIGVVQMMIDQRTLRVVVINLHVGPLSFRSALAYRLEKAGFMVEAAFKVNSLTVFCNTDDYNDRYVEIPLNR